MRRGARRSMLILLLLLLAGAVETLRLQLEAQRRATPSAELLYLPKGPYLRALAVGHEESLADLIYIWALQYYSNYDKEARRSYLGAVFRDAITELDPRFTEAYMIGALIMSLEYRQTGDALALYDKGLAAMPDNWELAYWAGWESYSQRQFLVARQYWSRAAQMPGAPPQLLRLAARMLERAGDIDAAIAEYRKLYDTSTDERTRRVAASWLQRMLQQRDAQRRAGKAP